MNQTIRRAVILAAALAAPAAAQSSPEALAVSAGERFQVVSLAAVTGGFRPTLSAGAPRLDAASEATFVDGLRNSAEVLRALSFRAASPRSVATLDLAALLNRHLKTTLRYSLSGRTVWFSGAFDAQQNPFVSVLVDGSAPLYFNVKALVNTDQHLSIGGAKYTLSLSPNIFHKMKSTINLKNDSNSREAAHFSVQDMLDAVSAAGQPVALSDQAYKFYYADGVSGGGRMFVFICGGGSDFHVYLVPEGSVPTDRMGVFSMYNGKRVGLARTPAGLQVYENP
jgi:hypothetical protein